MKEKVARMLKIILYLLHQEKVFVENENAFVIYDLLSQSQGILVYILMACPRIEVTSDPNIPWTPALERTGIFRTLILFHQRLLLLHSQTRVCL